MSVWTIVISEPALTLRMDLFQPSVFSNLSVAVSGMGKLRFMVDSVNARQTRTRLLRFHMKTEQRTSSIFVL